MVEMRSGYETIHWIFPQLYQEFSSGKLGCRVFVLYCPLALEEKPNGTPNFTGLYLRHYLKMYSCAPHK